MLLLILLGKTLATHTCTHTNSFPHSSVGSDVDLCCIEYHKHSKFQTNDYASCKYLFYQQKIQEYRLESFHTNLIKFSTYQIFFNMDVGFSITELISIEYKK